MMGSENPNGDGKAPTAAELKLQFKLDAAMDARARDHDISERAIARAARCWQKSKGELVRVMKVVHREKKIMFRLAADATEPYYKKAVRKKKGKATKAKPRRRARTTPANTTSDAVPAALDMNRDSLARVAVSAARILKEHGTQEIDALIDVLKFLRKQGV